MPHALCMDHAANLSRPRKGPNSMDQVTMSLCRVPKSKMSHCSLHSTRELRLKNPQKLSGPCHAAPILTSSQVLAMPPQKLPGHFEFFLGFVTMRFASLGPNGQSLKKSKQSTQAARKQGLQIQIAVAVACWNAKSLQQSAIFPKQPCEDPNLVPGTPLMRSKQ